MADSEEQSLLDSIFNPQDPNESQYLEVINLRRKHGDRALDAARKTLARNENVLAQYGAPPTPESEPGFLYDFLDTLSTPQQWITGGVASLVGHPGYEDLDLTQGASKGSEEDITTGQLLRENSFFREHPFLRGAAGFAGDVVSDPLNYISIGKGIGAALGGAPVVADTFNTISDPAMLSQYRALMKDGAEIPDALRSAMTPDTLANISQRLSDASQLDELSSMKQSFYDVLDLPSEFTGIPASSLPDELFSPELVGAAQARGALKSSQPFQAARSLDFMIKKAKASGLTGLDESSALFNKYVEDKTIKIADQLGLTDPEDVLRLFKKRAVRFSGPFAGAGTLGRIPILGERELDIPVVTAASEEMFKLLDEGYYGAQVSVKNFINNGVASSPNNPFYRGASALARLGSKVSDGSLKMASLISRSTQASGQFGFDTTPIDLIKEHERASSALLQNTIEEGRFVFRNILRRPESEGVLNDFARHLEIPATTDDPRVFEEAVAGFKNKWNTAAPGLGDEAEKTLRYVQQSFREMAEVGLREGTLDSELDGYVAHMYNPRPGMEGELEKIAGLVSTNGFDFSLERVFGTLREAKNRGYNPDENIFNIWVARKLWHERQLAEKDFIQRLAMQHALPENVYNSVRDIALKASDIRARSAADVLIRHGAPIDRSLMPTNQLVSPKQYASIKETFFDPGLKRDYGTLEQMMAQAKKEGTDLKIAPSIKNAHKLYKSALEKVDKSLGGLADDGIKFLPEEEGLIAKQFDEAKGIQEMQVGRSGESLYARAGGVTRPKGLLRHARGLSKEDMQYWDGVLPQTLVKAYQDSNETFDLLKAFTNSRGKSNPNDPINPILRGVLGQYQKFHRVMKMASTVLWPGYWVGNAYGSQVQGLPAASALGSAFNLFNLARSHQVFYDGANVVTRVGKEIPNAQFLAELPMAGATGSATQIADMMVTFGDYLHQMTLDSPGVARGLGMGNKFLKHKGWLANRTGLTFLDTSKDFLQTLGARIEAFGRGHLYMQLRIDGFDAASAAAKVNELLIDYSHGKTSFERNILNNVFFFYSFSRGNAANSFITMLTKPGALSTQLHAHKAIAEMLTDPNNLVAGQEDIDEAVRTTRMSESLSTYVGTNPETKLPQILSRTRLPIEDLAQWANIYTPKNLTANGIINAAGKSVTRSAQSVLAQVNPGVRGILEMIFQKNLYFDRPITDATLNRIPKWEKDINVIAHYPIGELPDAVWETVDDVTKAVLGGRDNGDGTFTINPYAMSVLTNFVPAASRFLSTREALSKPGVGASQKYLRGITGIHLDEVRPEQGLIYDKLRRQQEQFQEYGIPTTKYGREIQDKYVDQDDDSDSEE